MPNLSEQSYMADAVRNAFLDPGWFCSTILRCPNDPWQTEGLEALLDIERKKLGIRTVVNHKGLNKISIRAGHGPGKTHFIAKAAHLFNYTHRGIIPATAPKERQLRTRLWPEFRMIRRGAISEYQQLIKVENTKIVWCDDEDWMMIAETASQPENLAGYHNDYLLFLVDEASGVAEEMYPVIEGSLSTGKFAALIMIGNPTRNKGSFHDSHMKKGVMDDYYRIHVTLDKTSRVSKKWVKTQEKKYGKNSPIVQIRCHGNFAKEDKNQLLALEWIVKGRERSREDDGSISKLRITADIADGGEDETVITVAQHFDTFKRILKVSRHSFKSSVAIIESGEEVIRLAGIYKFKKNHVDDMVIDCIGVGAGTAGYLMKKGYPVIEYRGGAKSDAPDKWRNRRTQSYIVCRNEFMDSAVDINEDAMDTEDWEDYYAQLCSIKTKAQEDKVETLITKKEMVGKSPDMADSLAMQFATQRPSYDDSPETIQVIQGTGIGYDDSSLI